MSAAAVVDLGTAVGSVVLPNPVMTASGTAGYGTEIAPYVTLGSLGAFVIKFHGIDGANEHAPHDGLVTLLETRDAAVRGARLFSLDDLNEIVVHPPIKRFLQRWQPGDPAVYLGSLWAR